MKIEALYISAGHNYVGRHGMESMDYAIQEVEKIECVAKRGIVNDRFYDFAEDYKGQITFFDMAVCRDMEEVLGKKLEGSVFRRNVLTSGIDLNSLIGETFSLNGILFQGSEECRPCYWMDEACAPGAEEALKGRGGLRARILTNGELAPGEYELLRGERTL